MCDLHSRLLLHDDYCFIHHRQSVYVISLAFGLSDVGRTFSAIIRILSRSCRHTRKSRTAATIRCFMFRQRPEFFCLNLCPVQIYTIWALAAFQEIQGEPYGIYPPGKQPQARVTWGILPQTPDQEPAPGPG